MANISMEIVIPVEIENFHKFQIEFLAECMAPYVRTSWIMQMPIKRNKSTIKFILFHILIFYEQRIDV